MLYARGRFRAACLCLILGTAAGATDLCADSRSARDGIQWTDWSESAFSTAKDTEKRVLVYLTATWCHARSRTFVVAQTV